MVRERLDHPLERHDRRRPLPGGATWAVLQYILGFQQLGHDVVLVEPVQPKSFRPVGTTLADFDNAAYFRSVSNAFGLGNGPGCC